MRSTPMWHFGRCGEDAVTPADSEDSGAQHVQPTFPVIGHAAAAAVTTAGGATGHAQIACPKPIWARRTVAANSMRPKVFTLLKGYDTFYGRYVPLS
jgi:hypothetical protein